MNGWKERKEKLFFVMKHEKRMKELKMSEMF